MADLETVLAQLTKHGKPAVSMLKGGWHCSVDMYVAATGASFTVRSDFGMSTPLTAAQQCGDRIDTMLRNIGGSETKAITHG